MYLEEPLARTLAWFIGPRIEVYVVCYLAEVLNQRLVDCQNLVPYDAMSNPAQVYIYAQHMVVAGSSLPGSEKWQGVACGGHCHDQGMA